MGLCASRPSIIASSAGGEREYQERYLESRTLGQGEFGVVKLVHDVTKKDLVGAKPYASKVLRKGFTFKDNTLYTPLKKKVLQGEVEILRKLDGRCYVLELVGVYESPSLIYMITEYCEGGEMVPWVSTAFRDASGLRTEDVSRVSYQLWCALDHCARHLVIHRDIKPENVMFCTKERDSELRLIDFGSGTLDSPEIREGEGGDGGDGDGDVERHHTFAGSAFYISPEMFQRTYTSKTDVWSAAATLYVLVAGYPADRLQEAFNILQGSRPGRLRDLPNLPDNMPETFYEMLEGALTYRHKQRMDAGELMKGEFAQFHIEHEDSAGGAGGGRGPISIHEVAAEAAGERADTVPVINPSLSIKRTSSVVLEGSVTRHSAYLGYLKFERSVTAALATMLSKDTCRRLLLSLRERHERETTRGGGADDSVRSKESGTEKKEGEREETALSESDDAARRGGADKKTNAGKLQVVTVKVLLDVVSNMDVEDDRELKEVVATIRALKNFGSYENFAYHISLLRQFVSLHARRGGGPGGGGPDDSDREASSVHGGNVWSALRKKRGLGASGHGREQDPDSSARSQNSFKSAGGGGMGMRRVGTATGALSSMAR